MHASYLCIFLAFVLCAAPAAAADGKAVDNEVEEQELEPDQDSKQAASGETAMSTGNVVASEETADARAARVRAEEEEVKREIQYDDDYIPAPENDLDSLESEFQREELQDKKHEAQFADFYDNVAKEISEKESQPAAMLEKDSVDSEPAEQETEAREESEDIELDEQISKAKQAPTDKTPEDEETPTVKVETPEKAAGDDRNATQPSPEDLLSGAGQSTILDSGKEETRATTTKTSPGPVFGESSGKCKECCRGGPVEDRDCPINDDPCINAAGCTGYHRCFGAETGFRQCQWKPNSTTQCHSGPNCMPSCRGRQIGLLGDTCNLYKPEDCDGNFVVKNSVGIQCKNLLNGNPSGKDLCTDLHICSPGDQLVSAQAKDTLPFQEPSPP
mmetsp:Transcript_60956/g.108315  ORF Transcript_60956/g.108315 Transcript_60956/m.108315 type:complete len:389 (+) Transcript_60956:88-1254(+)|eukprot:CAMPEP_0197654612 /NCGR_PEP_ID=MMETSP1338-20131121/38952_1 /TAXON_ID=43686 ORGANISM="Pelagodinium beii, Strain RCC1491" /NCGR_SAMPLE_ID=MMETSP1338 /ASSEMBLY_ACC=CAM_ASM_000754 /LENGTH=388 /DNA_ID=CAMNT_0043230087 /DNA_START=88 /DNA_END=1254 /DNA_ORIENTATION=-